MSSGGGKYPAGDQVSLLGKYGDDLRAKISGQSLPSVQGAKFQNGFEIINSASSPRRLIGLLTYLSALSEDIYPFVPLVSTKARQCSLVFLSRLLS